MINPMTCVCVLMAAGSGLYLFQEKQQVHLLDRRIEQVLHAADAAHARTGMLRAEYALLNDPSRLQELARQHLPSLVNTEPTQFANLAELDRRLPTVGSAAAAEPAPLEPAAPLMRLSQATAPAVASIPAAPAPVISHAATSAPRLAFHATPAHAIPAAIIEAPAPSLVAVAQPPVLAHATRAVSRAATQRAAAIHQLANRGPVNQRLAYAFRGDPYVTPPAPVAEATQRIARAAPVDAGSPMVASALGMARSMMASSPAAPSATAAAFYSGVPQSR